MKLQSKSPVRSAATLSAKAASQGARRATVEAALAAAPIDGSSATMEVVARAKRRTFSTADRRRILAAVDRCTLPGEIGALLRREGVYSSSLSTWRRQRDATELAALAPRQRGPKVDPLRAEAQHLAQLQRDNQKLQSRLDKALLIIEVQKKVATLLGLASADDNGAST